MANISGIGPQVTPGRGAGTDGAGRVDPVTWSGGSPIVGRNEAFLNSQWDRATGGAAALLSTTPGELASQLTGSTTLSDLANSKGVPVANVLDAVSTGLRSTIPSWKTAGGHVDVGGLAAMIVHTSGIGAAVAGSQAVDGLPATSRDGEAPGPTLNTYA